MRRNLSLKVRLNSGLPRRFGRRGALFFLFTLVIITTIEPVTARPATSDSNIYFKLSQGVNLTDGLPESGWMDQFYPTRDTPSDKVTVRKLRLPKQAAEHELFQNIFQVHLSAGIDIDGLLLRMVESGEVLWAEKKPVRSIDKLGIEGIDNFDAPPNDPFYSLQWALDKIHAAAGWDVARGDSTVVIAVVDVGTDIGHGDLLQKLWVNTVERSGRQGFDDDGNGYIDDLNGWDFYDDDADPRPRADDSHGTHVAGIAAAGTDNGFGIAGVGWNCRMMAIRAGVGVGITHGFEGLIYAVANGADVVNLSWGGEGISQIERIAVEYAALQGVLVVAAAGNLGGSQRFDHYPAAYDQVLAVASTNDHDRRSVFSNSGSWVDLCAPGDSILSLLPNQRYGVESGTSMATPIVAGAAGLLKSLHPDWSPIRLKTQLQSSCDPIDHLNGSFAGFLGSGRLNLYNALAGRHPGIVIDSIAVVEPGGDGIIDPGERIQIYFRLYNPLQLPSAISLRLRGGSPLIAVDDLTLGPITLQPNDYLITDLTPFRARISSNTADDITLTCYLEVTRDGSTISIPFSITVRQSYGTIRNEHIALTISDMGSLGYRDYERDIGFGEGFRFPAGGLSALFHGSFMAGASGGRVSDNAYGNDDQNREDFSVIDAGVSLAFTEDAVTAVSHFSDGDADTVLGLECWQTSTVYKGEFGGAFALLEYQISLLEGYMPLDTAYFGLYLDWDIGRADMNALFLDESTGLGWMQSETGHDDAESSPSFGVGLIAPEATFYAGVNRANVARNWTDGAKSEIFRSGFTRSRGETPDDWAQMIGCGPLSINQADTLRVAFVLVAGYSLGDLRDGLGRAIERYGINNFRQSVQLHADYGFGTIFPQPFNSRTTVICRLAPGSSFRWEVRDPLGRLALNGGGVSTAELFPILIDGSLMPGGFYIVSLESKGNSWSRPVILLK